MERDALGEVVLGKKEQDRRGWSSALSFLRCHLRRGGSIVLLAKAPIANDRIGRNYERPTRASPHT